MQAYCALRNVFGKHVYIIVSAHVFLSDRKYPLLKFYTDFKLRYLKICLKMLSGIQLLR